MFGNKSLTTSKKNDRFFAPWLSSLGPWSDSLTPFSNLRDEIMDVFDNFNLANMPSPSTSFMTKVEIKDQGTSYLVAAEVPGMTDKDMSVTVRDNCLILEGEKKEEHKEGNIIDSYEVEADDAGRCAYHDRTHRSYPARRRSDGHETCNCA
jgi:HSP20 family molecular chaperone IbpA